MKSKKKRIKPLKWERTEEIPSQQFDERSVYFDAKHLVKGCEFLFCIDLDSPLRWKNKKTRVEFAAWFTDGDDPGVSKTFTVNDSIESIEETELPSYKEALLDLVIDKLMENTVTVIKLKESL